MTQAQKVSSMRILASLFALFLMTAPAASQTGSTSHDQAALEFLEVIGMPKLLQEVSVAMADNLIRTNPVLASRREVLLEWSKQYITWEAAAPELTQTYKRAFTEAELREIIAFYTTPTGQKMGARLPELMQSAAEVGGRLANAHVADLQKMITERTNPPSSPSTTTP
jgi:hypothetical protein